MLPVRSAAQSGRSRAHPPSENHSQDLRSHGGFVRGSKKKAASLPLRIGIMALISPLTGTECSCPWPINAHALKSRPRTTLTEPEVPSAGPGHLQPSELQPVPPLPEPHCRCCSQLLYRSHDLQSRTTNHSGTQSRMTISSGTQSRMTIRSGTQSRMTNHSGTQSRMTNHSGTQSRMTNHRNSRTRERTLSCGRLGSQHRMTGSTHPDGFRNVPVGNANGTSSQRDERGSALAEDNIGSCVRLPQCSAAAALLQAAAIQIDSSSSTSIGDNKTANRVGLARAGTTRTVCMRPTLPEISMHPILTDRHLSNKLPGFPESRLPKIGHSRIRVGSGFRSGGRSFFRPVDYGVGGETDVSVTRSAGIRWTSPVRSMQAMAAEELRAADFKPGQVVRVVQKPHGVGLAVTNSPSGCMLPDHEILSQVRVFRSDP